jgi:hypothetical protein
MKPEGLLAEEGGKRGRVDGGQDPMAFVSQMILCVRGHERSSSVVVCKCRCPMTISKWEGHQKITLRYLSTTIHIGRERYKLTSKYEAASMVGHLEYLECTISATMASRQRVKLLDLVCLTAYSI